MQRMEKRAVPLFSAAAVNDGLELESAVRRVLRSHWYVLGEEVKGFELEFAAYVGVGHCVSVANGTDALELALRSLRLSAGATVACAANAGFYASAAARLAGLTPVYVDVEESTLTMSADALQALLASNKPAAVVLTHLYGQLADVERIAQLCRGAGVPLIEDCAQAHGARRAGRHAGSFGDLACFSFYPTKNLGALGDGGVVLTSHEGHAEHLRSLRQYGWSRKYVVSAPGGRNSRLDEIQAALLRAKLPHLDRQNEQRRAIAARYNSAFSGLPLRCPASVGQDFVAHLYVVRTKERDALRTYLADRGVATDVHYPLADPHQPAYKSASDPSVHLPATEQACASVVSLPCYPGMLDEDVTHVTQSVQSFFSARH